MVQAVERTLRFAVVLTLSVLWSPGALAASSAPADTARVIERVLQNVVDVGSGAVSEVDVTSQAEAENLMSHAEAALWLPASGRVRLFLAGEGRSPKATRAPRTLAARQGIETFLRDLPAAYPDFTKGEYLLMIPATFPAIPGAKEKGPGTPVATAAPGVSPYAAAIIFHDDFETANSSWNITDNTGGAHKWGRTTCDQNGGSYSAAVLAGGSAYTHLCTEQYPDSYRTDMVRAACDNVSGAATAWFDAYIQVNADNWVGSTKTDYLGITYPNDAGSALYGPAYFGSIASWFHVNIDMTNWPGLGDMTARSCRKLDLLFVSDAASHHTYGARIDDISVGIATAGGVPDTCSPNATTLCLHANRFRVTAEYWGVDGNPARGQAVKLTGADDSGYFWFFDAANMEIGAKIASFCSGGSGQYGFYVSGLTDVQVIVSVTDTKDGTTWHHDNAAGQNFCKDAVGGFSCP